jgi:hypothetical protein
MHSMGQILMRLAGGIVHAMFNTVIVMVSGKYFYSAWKGVGREAILESGEALLVAAIVISLLTVVFWLVPVRRRAAGAAVITAVAIVAAAAGSLVLGTQGAS